MFKRSQTLFFDSPLGVISLAFFVGVAGAAFHLASHIDIDYFDAHNFLLQARRLTDDQFAFVGFDSRRPRSLVMLITTFNVVYHFFFSEYPSLTVYHYLMVCVSLSFALIWVLIIRDLWNNSVAYLSLIFLLSAQLFIHYAPLMLSDTIAGLGWGMLFWTFLKVLKLWHPELSYRKKRRLAIWLGFIGAIAALTKNHMLALLPGLLFFLYLAWNWPRPKEKRKWFWICGFSFLLAIDLITRIFGYWGEGIPEHLRHLYVQAKDQVAETTPPELYVQNLYLMFGGLFWGLSAISSIVTVLTIGKDYRDAAFWKKMGLVSFVLMTTVYLLLTQLISHREVRYLLPFLPALFAFIAVGILRIYQNLPRGYQLAWVGLWLVALYHPLARSWNDLNVYYQDSIYEAKQSNTEGMWKFLGESQCKKIEACRFSLRPQTPFELPKDPYYRQYDYEPQFAYFGAAPTTAHHCPVAAGPRNYYEYAKHIGKTIQPQTCFVLREDSKKRLNYLVVLKTLGVSLSKKQMQEITQNRSSDSRKICYQRDGGDNNYDCFAYQKFFGR